MLPDDHRAKAQAQQGDLVMLIFLGSAKISTIQHNLDLGHEHVRLIENEKHDIEYVKKYL